MPEQPSSTILNVDDDEATRFTFSWALREAGFEVREAGTGAEALRLAAAGPDLVLLDVNLPDLDGFEVCRRLKADPATAAIPVLHVSGAKVGGLDKAQGLDGGADGYLTKPVEPDELVAHVKALLRIRQAEKALRASEARQRAVLESALDAIVAMDHEGKVVEFNPAAEQVFGYRRQDVLGRDLADLIIPVSWRAAHGRGLARYLAAGEGPMLGKRIEVAAARADGTEFLAELSIVRIPGSEPPLFTGFIRDISERKEAEEALRRHADEIERSNRELEAFAYVASHDLQEPLRIVGSYCELLGRRYQGRLDAQADQWIGFACDAARRMQALIQDLLAYSRLGSRAKPPGPTDCSAVLDRAVANLRVAIAESGALVTRGPLPTLEADGSQLVQVFQNLLGNAIKFRGAEPPRVHVAARRDGDAWVFSVRDNGIGLKQEHAERIFQMFKRLHPRGKYPGTGIGLAVCKKVVGRHGGRIWVESEPGRGSVFFFTLPARREQP
jgi:PAS domain S-box-containing protein